MAKPYSVAERKEIERKFEATAFRLTQERNDFFLPQIRDFVDRKKWINLRPEYQRRLVWDDKKRSLFIESLLLNIPIPPLFLYEWELGRYEVMDGQQRLNAVVDFYCNGYALKGLEKWPELDGLFFKDLPSTIQRGLDRRRLSAIVLLVENPAQEANQSEVRKLVFERLNTGGQTLNAQELRNCLYDGAFNDLLIRLARLPDFTSAWEIPNFRKNSDDHGDAKPRLAADKLYKRMTDCEIVLRFFALRQRSRVRGSMRKILDRCMEDGMSLGQEEIAKLELEFRSRLKLAREVFGEEVFRYREKGKLKLSQPLFDAQMVGIDRLWNSRTALVKKRTAIKKALAAEISKPAVHEIVVGRPNTALAIQKRIDAVTKVLARTAGIA